MPPDPHRTPEIMGSLGDSVEAALSEALLAERERASFLSDSSRALAGSLNVDRLAIRVLRLAVPRLGDTATLALGSARPRAWAADVEQSPHPVDAAAALAQDVTAHALATGRTRLSEAGDQLAVPLVARGTMFGTFTVARTEPYDEPDTFFVEDFTQRASLAIDAARIYADRSHIARVLEANLRPPHLPVIPGVRIATGYRSAADSDGLGGDFYDVYGRDGDWTVVLGDVCGKGVEAAVVTGRTRECIRTANHVDRQPAAILRLLNRTLIDIEDAPFVTLICARLRPVPDGSVQVDLARAGHPPALVVRHDGGIDRVEPMGMIAGTLPDADFGEAHVVLAPGEMCVLYTDGVTEARRGQSEFGVSRLVDTVSAMAQTHPQGIVDVVLERVLVHLDGRPHDDIALLVFQAHPESVT
jgi:serine phosphatase RsbU (regulator of sigma subunit)